MTEEMVLGVPRQLLEELKIGQGLQFGVEARMEALLDARNSRFRPRSQAEQDSGFKQLIPYVLIQKGNKWLHYVRGKASGEKRLVSKGSIGIGGHINPGDNSLFHRGPEFYEAALQREISEELSLNGAFPTQVLALLNDDSTPVGQVHLGIVHLCRMDNLDVTKRESSITELRFLTLKQLARRRRRLETWSQLCLDYLLKCDRQEAETGRDPIGRTGQA
jgi:predicted NUDIX family phosphoesterase